VDSNNEKVVVRGYIDYGISYAQKSPEALHTFFAVVEAKAVGKLDNHTWAQLLCYMGTSALISSLMKAND
jgi:hypothetical protein